MHESQKFCLGYDVTSVRPSVHPYVRTSTVEALVSDPRELEKVVVTRAGRL